MSPKAMHDDFRRLFSISKSDLLVAEILLKAANPGIRQEEICLHCHAAMEKALKAISFLNGYEPPFTHRLSVLFEHIIKNNGKDMLPPNFDINKFSFLDAYSSVARYEDLLPKNMNQVAQAIFIDVKAIINEIETINLQSDAHN